MIQKETFPILHSQLCSHQSHFLFITISFSIFTSWYLKNMFFFIFPSYSHIILFDRSWNNNSGWPQSSSSDRTSKQEKQWRKFTVQLHHEPNRPKQRALYREVHAFLVVCGNFFKRDGCHSSSQHKSEQTHKKNKRMPHVSTDHTVVELEINSKKLHKSLEIAQYTPEWQIYRRNRGKVKKFLESNELKMQLIRIFGLQLRQLRQF